VFRQSLLAVPGKPATNELLDTTRLLPPLSSRHENSLRHQ